MIIKEFHSTGLKLAMALVAGFLFHNTAGAADLNQTKESFSAEVTKTFAYKYLKYLPDGYDGKKKFPLLLFLHGAGERGDNLDLVTKHGPPKLINKGKNSHLSSSPHSASRTVGGMQRDWTRCLTNSSASTPWTSPASTVPA